MTLSNNALEPPCRTTKPVGRPVWPAGLGTLLVLVLLCWAYFFKGIDQLFPLDKTKSLQMALPGPYDGQDG